MTLADFLLARIAEDEALAREVEADEPRWDQTWDEEYEPDSSYPAVRMIGKWSPARVLAECEAKRRIVEELAIPYIAERRRLMNGQPSWGDEHPELLRWLALPYADHPDYREEWRP